MLPRRLATPLAAALLILAAACSSNSQPDVTACKKAMEDQMADAMETGAEGSRPAACVGVDAATLERLVGEVLDTDPVADQTEKDVEDAMREEYEKEFGEPEQEQEPELDIR